MSAFTSLNRHRLKFHAVALRSFAGTFSLHLLTFKYGRANFSSPDLPVPPRPHDLISPYSIA